MNAPQAPIAPADALTDKAVIDLARPIQALPGNDAPIIELTDRIQPQPEDFISVIDLAEPVVASGEVASVANAVDATKTDENDHRASEPGSGGDVIIGDQDDPIHDFVFAEDIQEDFDTLSDDFGDSLGIEITPVSETHQTPNEMPLDEAPSAFELVDFNEEKVDVSQDEKEVAQATAGGDDDAGAPALTPEKLESALERVIEKIYAEKIEGILVETIERVVTREIDRIKTMLSGDRDMDDER